MKKHWNYRIIELKEEHPGEPYYQLREVHYEDEKPVLLNTDPAVVDGGSTEEIEVVLHKMTEALKKPILKESDFDPK